MPSCITGSDFSSCLRPEFTALLATRLLCGDSINLISPHGQGRRRTLADLRQALPESLHIYQVNMRDYYADFKGFYDSLCFQSGSPNEGGENLNRLLDMIEREARQSLFILHNFDEIRRWKERDSDYDNSFFQALNSVCRRKNIALLCVCESLHDHYLLQADGTELADSNLAAEPLQMPALTHDQLLIELQQRSLPVETSELPALCDWLISQDAPYSMLDQLNTDWFEQQGWRQS